MSSVTSLSNQCNNMQCLFLCSLGSFSQHRFYTSVHEKNPHCCHSTNNPDCNICRVFGSLTNEINFFQEVFLPALHVYSHYARFSPETLSLHSGLLQVSSLYTGSLSKHLKQLLCSVSLLCSHSYSNSSLEGEPGCVKFCICFLVPGTLPSLPLIHAPASAYLSLLSVARKQVGHQRPPSS